MEARQALMCTHGYPREIMELLKGLYHHPFMLKVNLAKIIILLWGSTVYLIPSIPVLTFLNCAFVELEGAFIFFLIFNLPSLLILGGGWPQNQIGCLADWSSSSTILFFITL